MARPNKLKDIILSKLDPDPAKAEEMYEQLSNDELIDMISDGVFIQHTSADCVMDRDFDN